MKIYSVNKSKTATAHRMQQLLMHGRGLTPITLPLEFDLETDEAYKAAMDKIGGRDPLE